MKKFLAFFLALLTVVSMAPAVSAAPATTGQDIVPMADTVLPSSYSLVEHNENGTLPPIDDQGQIGSCVGQAVTYMQFSNAVARYMQEIKGNKNWKPNDGSEYGDDRYLFSPKWTLNYSGAGTQWVYVSFFTWVFLPRPRVNSSREPADPSTKTLPCIINM